MLAEILFLRGEMLNNCRRLIEDGMMDMKPEDEYKELKDTRCKIEDLIKKALTFLEHKFGYARTTLPAQNYGDEAINLSIIICKINMLDAIRKKLNTLKETEENKVTREMLIASFESNFDELVVIANDEKERLDMVINALSRMYGIGAERDIFVAVSHIINNTRIRYENLTKELDAI